MSVSTSVSTALAPEVLQPVIGPRAAVFIGPRAAVFIGPRAAVFIGPRAARSRVVYPTRALIGRTTVHPRPAVVRHATPRPAVVRHATPRPGPVRHQGRSWLSGQEAALDIPALGLHRAVFAGGQDTIDQGVITHFTASDHFPSVGAGQRGVYWLAGHHSTHGSPFAALTSARVGQRAVITLRSGRAITYRITAIARTGTWIPDSVFYGGGPGAARLMMQTCLSSSRRLLVFGTRVG